MTKLSHINKEGRPKMVDVSRKPSLYRRATATGDISLNEQTLSLIKANQVAKGNVLVTAELAGVMGAKRTADLIPLCHPLSLSKVDVAATLTDTGVSVEATAITTAATGVEMEALTAVNIALLTVYDMCKASDKKMVLSRIQLVEKIKKEV